MKIERYRTFVLPLLAFTAVIFSGCSKRNVDPHERLVQQLLRQVEAIPFVESHAHIPLPDDIQDKFKDGSFRYDAVYAIGGATYVAQLITGKDWQELKQRIEMNAHHAYYRPMVLAMRDLYGLGKEEELNDQNVEEISRQMNSAHRKQGWYDEIMTRANVERILWMDWDGEDKHTQKGNRLKSVVFHPVWNVDGKLVYIAGKAEEKDGGEFKLDRVDKWAGRKVKALADMEDLIHRSVSEFFHKGGVALKTTSAYFRSLDFDLDVPRHQAERVFARVVARREITEKEQRLLEDYLMARVLEAADSAKAPVQFHTGNQQSQNIIDYSNPLHLNRLILSGKFKQIKFVLLHGGYPYTSEAIMLTKYFPGSVYLDLAWMALFSPEAAKRSLSEALDMLDGSQLLMGTDTANLEEFYGTVKITRRIVAEVLAEKVESGLWTEQVALNAARRILNKNVVELYGLK